MRIRAVFLLLFLFASNCGHSQSRQTLREVDRMMAAGLRAGHYPGAVLAVGNSEGLLFEKAYGYTDTTKRYSVTTGHLYDVASLTKVVATTFAVMRLYDRDSININKNVGDYLEDYKNTAVSDISVSRLLTHTSGLPYFPAYTLIMSNKTGEKLVHNKYDKELYPIQVDRNLYLCAEPEADSLYISFDPVDGYRRAGHSLYVNPQIDTLVRNRIIASYNPDLMGKYRYSDTNFYLLRKIVEKITDQNFDLYTRKLFDEIGMENTGFNPLDWIQPRLIIPTEYDYLLQREQVHGYVHDDLSAINGNVEGNAGIFSTASDLARFCRMLLGEGKFEGRQIISSRTVNLFTSSPLRSKGIHRGLGFDKRAPGSTLYDGFGHTGYTGTMIWIDPSRDLFMVFLSNRVHPTRVNNGLNNSQLRANIWEVLKEES